MADDGDEEERESLEVTPPPIAPSSPSGSPSDGAGGRRAGGSFADAGDPDHFGGRDEAGLSNTGKERLEGEPAYAPKGIWAM